MSITNKIQQILIAVDDAASAVLFSTGNNVTISARCGMALLDHAQGVYDPSGPHGIEERMLLALAQGLDDLQKQHVYLAIDGDHARAAQALHLLDPYVLRLHGEGLLP